MAEFEREFAHGNVIKLEQNYRSHGHILTAANTLISQNAHRLGKNLWTAEGEGEPIRVFDAYSDQEEARFVVEEVRALNREGINLSDMALLYRSNAQSRVLEHALFSANVPYRVYGGLRFFERQEIKHALAYLRLLTNPEDDGAFLRVVNFPTRGIGARTLEQLADNAARSGASLWQAACTGGGKVAGFAKLIEDIKQVTRDLPLPEVIDHVIEASGLARLLPRRQGWRRPAGKPQRTGQRRDAVFRRRRKTRLVAGQIDAAKRRGMNPPRSGHSTSFSRTPRWRPANTRPSPVRMRCN